MGAHVSVYFRLVLLSAGRVVIRKYRLAEVESKVIGVDVGWCTCVRVSSDYHPPNIFTRYQLLMGDYKFSVNSSVGSVSSVDFPVSTTSNSSLFFTTPSSVPDSVPSLQHSSSMQDDLLIEKSSHKGQHGSQHSDLNGDHSHKSKDEDGSMGIQDKQNDQSQLGPAVSAPLQLPSGYNVSDPSLNVINSSNPSGSLWSSGPMDDALMQSLNVGPAVNGTLSFQNFPQNTPNAMYNSSLGHQMAGLPQTQVQPPQQRRAITASHNFPHNLSRHMQQQNHPQNMYMASKGYTSWSSPQQNSWSQGPQNQANMTGISPWNRGRSVPNLNPMQQMANRKPSPTFNHQHSGMVISPKFRRSTSYPGKGLFPQPPTFEITNMDENREMLLPYQVNIFHTVLVLPILIGAPLPLFLLTMYVGIIFFLTLGYRYLLVYF